MTATVRAAGPADESDWRRLFAAYCAFYQTDLPEATVARTWSRILDPAAPIFARIAEVDGRVVGFANCVLHEGTFATSPLCYLEDLFVDPDLRGRRVGQVLIDDLVALARANGWDRLYWLTRAGNDTARRLYDRYGPVTDFVVYRPKLR